MTPFPTLAALPRQLHTPRVRDLAWVMLSPPMLAETQWQQRHPLSASDWVDNPHALESFLRQLDQDSDPLSEWLARSSIRRLGLYYERLWQFAIHHAPGVELIAANLPIRVENHTLGELDMLLRDKDGVHHLELAIKFYLGPLEADGHDPLNWLGPGSQDTLGSKLAHLNEHQLPMSARPETRQALAALGIEEVQAHVWLGGYLLYPFRGPQTSPTGTHSDHPKGQWLAQKDWPAFIAERPNEHWQWVPRTQWLGPARVDTPWSRETLQGWLTQLDPAERAQLLVRLTETRDGDWEEAERVFLVSDRWPEWVNTDEVRSSIATLTPPA
ncbi:MULTISPECIES: DUF1853 family protein [unclassified Pseudomonas]|uniref:DUF1853 family protein n=1 Tax=unclassified Pseudomonas TaxID=196821 RepID=UPI00384F42B8